MKLLINYANFLFRKSQKLNTKTGIEFGTFDKVISYAPKDIDSAFFFTPWASILQYIHANKACFNCRA